MGDFDELDAAMADARAARAGRRDAGLKHEAEKADFVRRFRDWAETVAAPTLAEVADHVSGLHEDSSVHVHHPDHGAGGRSSVDLNIRLMGEYIQLTFRPLASELQVGVSENHGVEVPVPLETLTADDIRHRAIDLVMQAITKAGHVE